MSSSISRNIYESLRDAVSGIKKENGYHYTIGETLVEWLDPGEMATKAPCACVMTSGKTLESQVGANTRARMDWLVATCIKVESNPSQEAMDLETDLEKAIMADVRRGGNATLTKVTRTFHGYGPDRRVVYIVVIGNCIYHAA